MQRRGDEDPGMADVKLVATLTMQLAYRNKDKLSAGMIIGGWDRKLGAQVYGIPLGGSMQRVPFTVGGSGSAYIYGWCDNTWRENMSRSDAEAWVARAISLAIARDASSGGVVRLVTIRLERLSTNTRSKPAPRTISPRLTCLVRRRRGEVGAHGRAQRRGGRLLR